MFNELTTDSFESGGSFTYEDLSKRFGIKPQLISKSKKGNKIHIKKKNEGKFTKYCGGKVTDECILKAKNSGNATLVKRATFALNAKRWKH